MLKKLLFFVLLALLVAACSQAPQTNTQVPPGTLLPSATAQVFPTPTLTIPKTVIPDIYEDCTVVSANPTPNATQESLFKPQREWSLGPEDATVTLIEYSDFQCPVCKQLTPLLKQLHIDFPEDVRVVFRHNPLIGTPEEIFHDKAAISAQAAEAAGAQGKFWEMHDLLFDTQAEWSALTPDQFEGWVISQTVELGLDKAQFTQDLTDAENVAYVQGLWDYNSSIGVVFTPLLLINGEPWPQDLPMSYQYLTAIVQLNLLKKRQFTTCPPQIIDPSRQYVATIKTEKGDIVLELFVERAPLAVNNFVFLARNGWYDGITFHRVITDFMAQAGDPTGTGFGGPGYMFANEISSELTFDRAGLLAMANSGGSQTNGSQFFITYAPAKHLNGGFTIFGQVISGDDVLKSLTPRNPDEDPYLPPGDKILTITIEER